MPVPEAARVIYGKNPLEEVICQLRFPTILRIGTEVPTDFQERVRNSFPLFAERNTPMTAELPSDIGKLLDTFSFQQSASEYEFKSENGEWSLTLTREYLALSTTNYKKWEEFRRRLEEPLTALMDVYVPSFFTRLGLRYRNVLRRSRLGLDQVSWASLLQPHIAGELASPVAEEIEEIGRQMTLRIGQVGRVRVSHGLTRSQATGEQCFVIDCDYFTKERTGTDHALGIFDTFNRESGKLFQWCIRKKLHKAMEPTPL